MEPLPDEMKPPRAAALLRELPNLALIWSSPVRRVRLDYPGDSPIARVAAPPIAPGANEAPAAAPVLVLPGILSADPATSLMRRTLRASGYYAYASRLGVVTGVTPVLFERARARLAYIHARHQVPVTLIGISLGGLYARVLAQRHPEMVGLVITLGTPFSGDRRANNAWRLYEAINDHTVDNPPLADNPSAKPPARTIAIWSRNDGIIAPACSRGTEGERDLAIEVPERHFEFSASRRSIARVLQVLAEHAPPPPPPPPPPLPRG